MSFYERSHLGNWLIYMIYILWFIFYLLHTLYFILLIFILLIAIPIIFFLFDQIFSTYIWTLTVSHIVDLFSQFFLLISQWYESFQSLHSFPCWFSNKNLAMLYSLSAPLPPTPLHKWGRMFDVVSPKPQSQAVMMRLGFSSMAFTVLLQFPRPSFWAQCMFLLLLQE